MLKITSPRLTLIPLDNNLLSIWNEKGRPELEKTLNINPNQWTVNELSNAETEDALKNFWIPQTLLNPENFQWFTNWEIVITDQNISIGGIGFGGYPTSGVTEIGYMIDEKYQKNGFATEALSCLLDWAFLNPILKTVMADTPKDNLPSQNVLLKNGFEKTGEGEVEHTITMQVYHWAKRRS